MEEAPVTAATGALGPVVAKLGVLLSSEYKLQRRTRSDVNFIKSKLKSVHSLLWNIWEREVLDEASKALKMEALDLADDMEDAIDDFILSIERSGSSRRFIQTKMKASPFEDLKKRVDDVSGRCCGRWKKKSSLSSNLFSRKKATTVVVKPQVRPFESKDASELVDIDGPRDKLIQHLVGFDEIAPVQLQLKMASIVGMAGSGKTTLADQVYQAIGDKFQSRAFVQLTPGGNIREVLAGILKQVAAGSSVPVAGTQAATKEHLIDIISNFLKDKRYLVIIDDIWHCGEWEFIRKSFPENFLGSRILTTTRNDSIDNKWDEDGDTLLYQMEPLGEEAVYWINPDMIGEDLDGSHPVVSMCGGLPLALVCMYSALAKAREHPEQQGLCVTTPDLQNRIWEQVKRNGIQNTPGFEPLVESLQLDYDNLPHHMLKTCLLYCSIYPEGHEFQTDDLFRQLMAERFVYNEATVGGYFEEILDRGFIPRRRFGMDHRRRIGMHPMMRNFLRWKSREDNFIACSSEIPSSCRIRRLCIDSDLNDPLSGLDWSLIRSLIVVDGDATTLPMEKLDHVRVLDLGRKSVAVDLKVMCGLSLRHVLGVGISEIPQEIGRMRHLETLEVKCTRITELPGEIGDLQQLKTLNVSDNKMLRVLPGETGDLQQLKTLIVSGNMLQELPREIGNLRQLKTLIVDGNKMLRELPREIGNLRQLNTLIVDGNKMLRELPHEIGNLRQLQNLVVGFNDMLQELPREIGNLQQLESLTVSSNDNLKELPSEIGDMHQLKFLNLAGSMITELPKEIGKLKHLEELVLIDTLLKKIPREIGGLKNLKSLELGEYGATIPLELWQITKSVQLPESIGKAWNKGDVVSSLTSEMLSFQLSSGEEGGLIVGAKQMHIPRWITEQFNDIHLLDIRICKLEEEGLKILREMPHLRELRLRFDVVPRNPIAISSEGFAKVEDLRIDSRAPRVTFLEGAMPMLRKVTFEFQFYCGPPNKDPLGIKNLLSLERVTFECSDWYRAGILCLNSTIDVVRKEFHEMMQTRVNTFVSDNVFRNSGWRRVVFSANKITDFSREDQVHLSMCDACAAACRTKIA